jgi:Zn-dependent peptidase ImmA (M78 family)
MKFRLNNVIWTIKEISEEEMQYHCGHEGWFTHGCTQYKENTIYINKSTHEKERTLIHELTHVWLYMYGHNQDEKKFDNEDVCEIVASINDFINRIVNSYRKYKDKRNKENEYKPKH